MKNLCDPVIPSGGICCHMILEPNWLKAFPVITHKQKVSKIDNNMFLFKDVSSKN